MVFAIYRYKLSVLQAVPGLNSLQHPDGHSSLMELIKWSSSIVSVRKSQICTQNIGIKHFCTLDVNVATIQLEHCTYGNHAFHDNTILCIPKYLGQHMSIAVSKYFYRGMSGCLAVNHLYIQKYQGQQDVNSSQ